MNNYQIIKSLNDLNSCLNYFTKFLQSTCQLQLVFFFSDREKASHTKCTFLTKCNSCRIAIQWFHIKRYSDILYTQKKSFQCKGGGRNRNTQRKLWTLDGRSLPGHIMPTYGNRTQVAAVTSESFNHSLSAGLLIMCKSIVGAISFTLSHDAHFDTKQQQQRKKKKKKKKQQQKNKKKQQQHFF